MKNFLIQILIIELLAVVLCGFFGKNLYLMIFSSTNKVKKIAKYTNLDDAVVQSGLKNSIANLVHVRGNSMAIQRGRFSGEGILMKIMAHETGTYSLYNDGRIKTELVGITPDEEGFIPLYMKTGERGWEPITLAFFGKKNGIQVGTGTVDRPLTANEENLLGQYDSATIEDRSQWFATVSQKKDIVASDIQHANDRVKTLNENGIHNIRVHALLYPQNMPDWLTAGTFSKDELRLIMKRRIEYVMSLYPTANSFVVVNEPFLPNNKRSQIDVFYKSWGSYEYITEAFQFARHYANVNNRKVDLLFNDGDNQYVTGTTRNSTRTIVSMLKGKNLIDGVGMQMHIGDWGGVNKISLGQMVMEFQNELAYYKKLAVPVYITEMTYMPTVGEILQGNIEKSASSIFESIVNAAIKSKNVKGIMTWGLTDKYLKPVGWYQLYDENAKPKESYYSVLNALYEGAIKNQK